jgi:hypothetical protein
MRFIVMVKANPDTEEGTLPTEQELTEMNAFNVELEEAGVLLAAEGLHPSSMGERIRFSDDDRMVVDGPFAGAEELVAGFWLWQCGDMNTAVEWAKRIPFRSGEVEIRPIFESDEFGEA